MIELYASVQPYWIWIAVACLLLAVEVLIVPAGFFLCMGTAAGIVALVLFVAPGLSGLWALTMFAVLMVIAGVFWWKVVRKRSRAHAEEDEGLLNVKTRQLIGYTTVLTEGLRNGRGRVRINDSPWPVEADADYPAGTRVKVVAVNGITLRVAAVDIEGE